MMSLKNIKNKIKFDKSYKNLSKEGKRKYIKGLLRDTGIHGTTILFGLATIAILIWMVVYIFTTGAGTLTWEFITSDYNQHSYSLRTPDNFEMPLETFENSTNAEYFSDKWGVAFDNGTDNLGDEVVYVTHIEDGSPFESLVDSEGNLTPVDTSYYLSSITGRDADNHRIRAVGRNGAEEVAANLNEMVQIETSSFRTKGNGIRGSLLTTLCLIGLSLLFALPLGIGAAIYLGVYAKNGPVTKAIRTLIDVTSGIPSIIFGLAGAVIFMPFVNSMTGSVGGSLYSGALTLAVMLLPTIVKTTEESIRVIPASLTQASLALGASRTQTTFKVVLPNALPGILTSTLLSIGRIIGESAALVFAMGTSIGDYVDPTQGNASLAVHIYVILGGETPRYDAACAISIIILVVVLVLSLLVKLISLRLNRFKGA